VTAVRRAGPADADALLALQTALDGESEFMLLEPAERESSPDELRRRLGDGPSYLIVAEGDEGELAGYVEVSVLPYARARSTGYVVMGVRASYAGRGLGRALLEAARDEAVTRGLRRLELTVMTHNRRALSLYLSCGFEVEGLRRDALVIGGVRRSEYYMGLLL
jgi:ribosomal protein S18 acetylase RimI-like enzyme